MGLLGELALRRVHVGKAARAYRLTIGGEPVRHIRSLKGEFDPRSGGSALSISVRDSLEGLEDAPVTLEVGYGKHLVPYFVGKLQEPSSLAEGQATAYGPFKLMADQSLGEPVTYQGNSLRFIFKDLERRAGYRDGIFDVIGGDQTVEKLDYTEETRLGEVAKAIADPAKYVFFDRPGGKRRAMPEPKPGTTGKIKARYSEHNYGRDGFKVKETREGHYAKVVVFRRGSNGNYLVRQPAPVLNRGRYEPPENRIFYVPEYPGNAAQGKQTAYETAYRLAFGELEFELGEIWINPELEAWDTISVERTERRSKRLTADGKPGKWLVTYECLIRSAFGFEITRDRHHMNLGGGAVKVAEHKLRDPIRLSLKRLITPGLVIAQPLQGLKPDVGLKPDIGLKPDKLHF